MSAPTFLGAIWGFTRPFERISRFWRIDFIPKLLPAVHARFDELRGDLAAERVLLLRQPYLTHTAFSDVPEKAVCTDDRVFL